jgi:hypothetical protein
MASLQPLTFGGSSLHMPGDGPFRFYTERRLIALTGLRARSLQELSLHLREVPPSSIFYHTHHSYLAHHFETPVFTNDFAIWTSVALREEALSERLAAVDLLAYTTLQDLRMALVSVVDKSIQEGSFGRECPRGDEFYFCRSKSFIMPTGRTARNPEEFFEILPQVSNESIFFHFFEARLRLGRPTNDFSIWLEIQGEPELARKIDMLDPYRSSLDEFRERIIGLGRSLVRSARS